MQYPASMAGDEGIEGQEGCFVWNENQAWVISNSDNSNPGGSSENKIKGNEEKSKKRGNNGKGSGGSSDHEIHIWTERERRKKMRNMFSNLHALLPQLPPKADKSTIVDEAVNYIKNLQQTLQNLQKQKLEMQAKATTSTILCDPSGSLAAAQQVTASDTRESFVADQMCLANASNDHANNANNPSNPRFPAPPALCPVAFQSWTSPNVILNICGNEAQLGICAEKNKVGLFSTVCYVLEKNGLEVVTAHLSSDSHRSIYMIHIRASAAGAVDNQIIDTLTIAEIFKQAAGEIMMWVSS